MTVLRINPDGPVPTIELPELFSLLRLGVNYETVSVDREANQWNGELTWAETLDAAQFGQWNAPKIDALTLPDMQADSEETRYFYDVTGQSLDVAAFVSGEPEYWLESEIVNKPCGQIFRLSVEIGGPGTIPELNLRNRGAAIIALVNSLELAGHSVEVTLVRSCMNKRNEKYNFLVPAKHAGQMLDMRRLQFMIGHPAFYRRVFFALIEFAQGCSLSKCVTYTTSYKPEGFTAHFSWADGLAETLTESMGWAKEFARSLTTNATN
ncbi:MAG TPA: hypothetical protein VGH83_05660 [Candidatus Acidoferrum sp.]